MSKSYNNAIFLSDSPDAIRKKVAQMITDPQRKRRSDPGDPDVCNVFTFHKIYSDQEVVESVNQECRKAEIGCVECKQKMAGFLVEALAPIRAKRSEYEAQPQLVEEIIQQGGDKARQVAQQTMAEVRQAIGV